MADEALIISRVAGDIPDKFVTLPGVTAHDFSTDPDRPTVTNGASGTRTFYRAVDRVLIQDDVTKAISAKSGQTYTDQIANASIYGAELIYAAYHKHLMDLGLNNTQKQATFSDASFQDLMIAIHLGDMDHVIYEADTVSTSLAGWDTTIRDIVKQVAQDWIDLHQDGIATASVTAGGSCSNGDGDYLVCQREGETSTSGTGLNGRLILTVSSGAVTAIESIENKGSLYTVSDTITVNKIGGVEMTTPATITVDSVGW